MGKATAPSTKRSPTNRRKPERNASRRDLLLGVRVLSYRPLSGAEQPGKDDLLQGRAATFLKAAPTMEPPLERIEIPFEGKKVVGYLQIPDGMNRPPVVMHWGGVDGWKEDRRTNNDDVAQDGPRLFHHRHAGCR